MYTTRRRYGLGENGGPAADGGEPGGGPSGGNPDAGAVDPSTGENVGAGGGSFGGGPGDLSPDVRGDDPFSGRPAGPFSGDFDPTFGATFSQPTTPTSPPASRSAFSVNCCAVNLGFISVGFDVRTGRAHIGSPMLGISINVDTRGLSLGPTAAPGTPGGGPAPSAEGGEGHPGGADSRPLIPFVPGLPPLVTITPSPTGSESLAAGAAVTVPWLWLGVAGAAILLTNQRRRTALKRR